MLVSVLHAAITLDIVRTPHYSYGSARHSGPAVRVNATAGPDQDGALAMNDLPTPAPRGTGPWRLLVLDRDPVDPRWLFATISIPSDIRPAVTDKAGHYQ